MILSFTVTSNNNVDPDQIKGFSLVFHVSNICPLLDKHQKHEMLRKTYICPKEDAYQRKILKKYDICSLLFIFAHLQFISIFWTNIISYFHKIIQ